MHKLMKDIPRNEKGFTLVELMVVVVIIGILVAIAIPIYSTVQATAHEKACFANQRNIDGVIAMYRAEGGTADLFNADDLNGTLVGPGPTPLGPYLQAVPRCPSGGTNYVIEKDRVKGCPATEAFNHGLYGS